MTIIKEYQEIPQVSPRTMQQVQCDRCPNTFTRQWPDWQQCRRCLQDLCISHPMSLGSSNIQFRHRDEENIITKRTVLMDGYCLDCLVIVTSQESLAMLVDGDISGG